jgi:outer membrane protein TolC
MMLAALPAGVAITLSACSDPLARPLLVRPEETAERLRHIDPIALDAFSLAPPVGIEQASEDLTEDILEQTEPPEVIGLALADVRADALRHNLQLQVELVNPDLARADLDAEAAKFESTFTGSIRRTKLDGPVAVGTEGTQVTIDSIEGGLIVPLQTGGTLDVNLPLTKTETNNPFALLDPAYDVDLRATLRQPLLRGAGIRVNTASILVARDQTRITDARTRLAAIRILSEADRAYWRLFAARAELEVRRRQYEIALEQVERSRRRVLAGEEAEVDILRARSAAGANIELIIVAEAETRRRQRDLKRIINRPDLPLDGPTRVELDTAPNPVGLDLDPDSLTEFALEHRMELFESELQLAIDALNIDVARNAALPALDADVTYNLNGLGGSAGDAFDSLGSTRFEDWILGLRAEIPIGNEFAEARLERALLQRVQTLADRSVLDTVIRQEVLDALDTMETSWQRIIAADLETVYTRETFEGETRQYEAGERTSTDVDDALNRAADAFARRARAIADYQIAQIDLAFATGTLLGHDAVRWEAQ